MNQDIKQQWVTALRSGEYQQGRERLRQRVTNTVDQFCCLGVLCDLYAKAHPSESTWLEPKFRQSIIEFDLGTMYNGLPITETQSLPYRVRNWAGLDGIDPKLTDGNMTMFASQYNDNGAKFDHIANLIEQQL